MMLLVLGIGQSLRRDDGAGPAAVRLWSETYPHTSQNPSVEFKIVELPGLDLLNFLQDYQAAILVDAVQSGAPPGTLHLLKENDLEAFSAGTGSAHGWGVAETLALGRKIDPSSLPDQLFLIGIEGEDFSPGEYLSSTVSEKLPQAAQAIENIIQSIVAQN